MRLWKMNAEMGVNRDAQVSGYKGRFDLTWGGPDRDWYYWCFIWGEKDHSWEHNGETYHNRRWAFERFWYDGPHAQLKLWYFTVAWSTPYTLPPEEMRET